MLAHSQVRSEFTENEIANGSDSIPGLYSFGFDSCALNGGHCADDHGSTRVAGHDNRGSLSSLAQCDSYATGRTCGYTFDLFDQCDFYSCFPGSTGRIFLRVVPTDISCRSPQPSSPTRELSSVMPALGSIRLLPAFFSRRASSKWHKRMRSTVSKPMESRSSEPLSHARKGTRGHRSGKHE